MSDKDGTWKAYNLDNGTHDCRNKEQSKQGPTTQDREARIDHVIKMVQSVITELEDLKK
jgi:hypothetical protein